MRVWARIERVNNYDGTYWRVVWEEDGEEKSERFYNDNPAVYGEPSSTVQVGNTDFDVEDLLGMESLSFQLDLKTGEIIEQSS